MRELAEEVKQSRTCAACFRAQHVPLMGDVRVPQADSDLDDIWYYVASKSGSVEITDRFIESITNRFLILASHPNIGRARDFV